MFLKVYDVFVISSKKIVFCFGCGPWGPHFCISWAKKQIFTWEYPLKQVTVQALLSRNLRQI